MKLLGFESVHHFSQENANTIGLDFNPELDEFVSEQVALRLEALKSKNFAEADRIRDELSAQGIQLKDSKDPETGERVTTWEVKR